MHALPASHGSSVSLRSRWALHFKSILSVVINTSLLSAADRQEGKKGEGDRKRDGNLSYNEAGCVCVTVCECMCVCLAVMTLCLWAPTEYVYLPQQQQAKMDDASLPHTHTHARTLYISPFPLLCSNCLPPAFSPFYTHTDPRSVPYYLLQSHILYRLFLPVLFSLPLVLQYAY